MSLRGIADASMGFVRATRPKQWPKNLIVFLALLFTLNEAWDPNDVSGLLSLATRTTLAFLVFSALSSAVYLVNDIFDLESDRSHPKKRFRPIASGQLPISGAWVGAAILASVALSSAFLLEPVFGAISIAYVAAMAAYTLAIKRLIILDVFVISLGFMLRTVAGAVVLGVPISPWLYICTGLGSLFIALAKRRSELSLAGENAQSQRDALRDYTLPVLDQFISVVATSTALAYALYTFTAPNLPANHAMMLTIPFVVYGLFRYMYLMHTKGLGENPEDVIITDAPLVVAVVLWLATAAVILGLLRG